MKMKSTPDELMVQEALERPIWEAPQLPAAREFPLKSLDLADLSTKKATPKKYAIEGIAPLAEVTLFTGAGGVGKSLLCQQFATAAASGMKCLGIKVVSGPAIYLTCEDDADQLHWRQQHLCEAARVEMAGLDGKLHLISLRGDIDAHFCAYKSDGILDEQVGYKRLAAMISATGAQLVFLDNVAHLFTGNENDRGQVTRFVNLLNGLAGKTGAAIILIAHPNKSGDNYSGSTAWLNAVRSQVTLDLQRDREGAIIDSDARVLSISKANYSQLGEAVKFRWHKGAFIREEDLPLDYLKELFAANRASKDDAIFLKCLDERIRQRRAVSEKSGANLAPVIFAKMPEAKGVSKERLGQAMDRLFRDGIIQNGPLWRDTSKGRNVTGLKRSDAQPQTPPPSDPQAHFPNDPKRAAINPQTHTVLSKDNNGQAIGQPAHDLDYAEWLKL